MATQSTLEIEAKLARIAGNQLGLITTEGAESLGIDASLLESRARQQTLHRLFPSVYRVASMRPTPHQYILAGALAVKGSTITRRSAALIHGFPLPRLFRSTGIDLIRRVDRQTRIEGLHVLRTKRVVDVSPWFSVEITTPAQTIVELAAVLDRSALSRSLDHGIISRLIDVVEVVKIVERTDATNLQGRGLLRELLVERVNGKARHRSGLEQRVARWLHADRRLRGFVPNFAVVTFNGIQVEGIEVEVDFGWPDDRVALEVSPFYTHGSAAKQERDMERRRLLALAGWHLIEATDVDLRSFAAFAPVAADLRALIRKGALVK